MTAGERNLRRQIEDGTVERPSLWLDRLLIACDLLERAVCLLLTILVGILLPYYVWLQVWPVDRNTAVQVWVLVAGGWAFAGLVWSWGRESQ